MRTGFAEIRNWFQAELEEERKRLLEVQLRLREAQLYRPPGWIRGSRPAGRPPAWRLSREENFWRNP